MCGLVQGRFRASGDPGPVSPGGTTDNTPRGREAPSTTRCIETPAPDASGVCHQGREAPSTIRCIETTKDRILRSLGWVGKHPAPSGALRLTFGEDYTAVAKVGKHPAPSGALRLIGTRSQRLRRRREAPSTIRCIETVDCEIKQTKSKVGKRPAPSGALGRWLLLSSLKFSFRSMGLAHNEAISHHTPLHRPTSSNATAAPSTSALPAHDAHTG